MTDVERGLALLHAHAAYVDRVLVCIGCDRPLHRKPGPGRDHGRCVPSRHIRIQPAELIQLGESSAPGPEDRRRVLQDIW